MEREKIRPLKTMKVLIGGILLGAMLLGGGYLMGRLAPDAVTTAEKMEAVVVDSKVLAAGELITAKYMYTDLGQYENSKMFYGTKIPFTTSKFMLSYDGVIQAGVDLQQVAVKADGLTKTVKVTVPDAVILGHTMDEESVQIFDEKSSLFNKISLQDYSEFFADQKKAIEEKAVGKGLLEEAEANAVVQLKGLLEPVVRGAGGEEWSVEVVNG